MLEVGEPDIDQFVEGMIKVRDELKNKGSANISKAHKIKKSITTRDTLLKYVYGISYLYYQNLYFNYINIHVGVTIWHKSLG